MPDLQAFRQAAQALDAIDVDVYAAYGRDPLEPIIGLGDRRCRVAVMGRDPGRHEVEHGLPFIGAGGQLVRRALYEALGGTPGTMDFAASVQAGERVFWSNTVPYKPIGNKAWGTRRQRAFRGLMADVLVHDWDGSDVLALGRDAVMWFGLADRETEPRLSAFWEREDRYEASVTVDVVAQDGATRAVTIHPVPHPSPLNATWYKRVPDILRSRLEVLGWNAQTWRLPV